MDEVLVNKAGAKLGTQHAISVTRGDHPTASDRGRRPGPLAGARGTTWVVTGDLSGQLGPGSLLEKAASAKERRGLRPRQLTGSLPGAAPPPEATSRNASLHPAGLLSQGTSQHSLRQTGNTQVS